MSPTEGRQECAQSGDAAAYALSALGAADAERFQEHLSGCATCRGLLADLRPVVDSLAGAVPPVSASAQLRERVMQTVNAEAELLHAAGSGADRPEVSRPRRRRSMLQLALGATAVAASVALGALLVGSGSKTPSTRVSAAVVSASAPGAHAVLREVGSHGELVVSGMPAPAAGKIYEVWLARAKSAPEPTDALFSPTRNGEASVNVPGSLSGVKQVMVTAEPLGGSSHPTSPAIVVATVQSA
jgi:hypothetical protein